MTSAIAIRMLVDNDVAAVTAIYRHAVIHGNGSFELEPPDEAEMAARCARIAREGYPFLVATLGEAVAGYAYVSAYRSRPAYRGTVEDSVYVREDAMGKGVGRALLARLIADCEAKGYRQMIAVIGDSANRASIRLHENLGFFHVGVFANVGWKHESWLDTVLMQRPLGLGAGAPPHAS